MSEFRSWAEASQQVGGPTAGPIGRSWPAMARKADGQLAGKLAEKLARKLAGNLAWKSATRARAIKQDLAGPGSKLAGRVLS